VTATAVLGDGPLAGLPGGMPDLEALREQARGRGDGKPEQRTEVRAMVMITDDAGDGGGGGDLRGPAGGLGLGGAMPPVLTDDSGRFAIRGLRQGRYDLVAEGMRGTARGLRPGVEPGDDTTVQLHALTRIDGMVTQAGAPVAQFQVQVTGPTWRRKSVRDERGRFSIHGVDPGEYAIEVTSAEGKGQATVTVAPGQPAEVAIELATMSTVSGIVVDAEGQPVAGAMVLLGSGSLGGEGDEAGHGEVSLMVMDDDDPTRTDGQGGFRLRAGAGKHILMVMSEGSPGPLVMRPIEVKPGEDLDLGKLEPGRARLGQRNP
jgi:hypothetical protein